MRNMKWNSRAVALIMVLVVLFALSLSRSDMEPQINAENRPTESIEAYNLYTTGLEAEKYFGWQRAMGYFQQAVEIDPEFAEACAELAFVKAYRDSEKTAAVNTIEKANALNPDLPAIYTARGMIDMRFNHDWASAEANFRKAIEIDPDYLIAYMQIDDVLILQGKDQEAFAFTHQAYEINSFQLGTLHQYMTMLEYMGFAPDAMQVCRQACALYPNNGGIPYTYSLFEAYNGNKETAIEGMHIYCEAVGADYEEIEGEAWICGLMGDTEIAAKFLAMENLGSGYVLQQNLGIREYNTVLDSLETFAAKNDPDLYTALLTCKRYRKDITEFPRWQTLVRAVGLPE